MAPRHRLLWLVGSIALGCAVAGGPEGSAGEAPEDEDPPQAPTRPESVTPAPAPAPADPADEPEPIAPAAASALPIRIVAKPGACPALHKGRSHRAAVLAHVLSRLACEPALFTMRTDALYRELGSPSGITVAFASPGLVTVRTEDLPSATELTTVLGLSSPQMRLRWNAYHASWSLVVDGYGPGSINVSVEQDAAHGDPQGKLLPVTHDTQLKGSLSVGLPDAAFELLPDAAAIAGVSDALRQLADDEALLQLPPEDAATRLGVDTERFRVARTSIHASGNVTLGLSLDPARTHLPAEALVEALGIEGARALNVNREHDKWDVEANGTTELQWHGLTIELSLDGVEGDSRQQPLGEATVDFITIYP